MNKAGSFTMYNTKPFLIVICPSHDHANDAECQWTLESPEQPLQRPQKWRSRRSFSRRGGYQRTGTASKICCRCCWCKATG